MTIGRGKTISHMYELCGIFLQGVSQEKYLGVLISSDLSWATHIQNVASSANLKLGFMKRNLKGSPKDLKRLAYITTVRSSLEYASTIWDPYQKDHTKLLEASQRKAARWIQNDFGQKSSVTKMMANLGLEPLEERRRISRLAFLYKILHEEVLYQPMSWVSSGTLALHVVLQQVTSSSFHDVKPPNLENTLWRRPSHSGTSFQKILHQLPPYKPLRASWMCIPTPVHNCHLKGHSIDSFLWYRNCEIGNYYSDSDSDTFTLGSPGFVTLSLLSYLPYLLIGQNIIKPS